MLSGVGVAAMQASIERGRAGPSSSGRARGASDIRRLAARFARPRDAAADQCGGVSATRKPKRKPKPKPKTCRKVRIKGTKRYRKVCKPKKKKAVAKKPVVAAPKPVAPVAAPVVAAPVVPIVAGAPVPEPSVAAPPVTTPEQPAPQPPPVEPPTAPGVPVYDGAFGVREAQRLLWRAGFGPKPGEAEALASRGLLSAVRSLTRPSGSANLVGAAPVLENGVPLAPHDAWGHDHLWWLDRMVRSDQPLVERMTLIWHDWLATSNADVGNQTLMLAQNDLLRRHALGSFAQLVHDITIDPAMLVFLSGISNTRWAPNENYARELMELFTLGADRGAYTEADVRDLARALTGWRATWSDPDGFVNFRFDAARADTGSKTLWAGTPHARTGAFDWSDACTLCLDNPYHRSFFVLKLWSYFVPSPPDAGTQAALEALYVSSGRSIAQVVEAILLHPDLYRGAPLVKPPVVYAAGLLRATGQTIATDAWTWLSGLAGQQLFYPPNVSGWNDRAWLDTSRLYGRWYMAVYAVRTGSRDSADYSGSTETGEQALASRRRRARQPGADGRERSRSLLRVRRPSRRRRASTARPTARCARTRCASSSPAAPTTRCADGCLRRLHPLPPAARLDRARGQRAADHRGRDAAAGRDRHDAALGDAARERARAGRLRRRPDGRAAGLRGGGRRGGGRAEGARLDLHGRRRGRAEPPRADRRPALRARCGRSSPCPRAPARRSKPTRASSGTRPLPGCGSSGTTRGSGSRSHPRSATTRRTSRTSRRGTSGRSARPTRSARPAGSGAISIASAARTSRSRG